MVEHRETKEKTCHNCGEPIKENWTFCPSCEASLEFVCPQCQKPVKKHWKRCPECEARIICRSCRRRIQADHTSCDICADGSPKFDETERRIIDPVTGIEFVYVPGGSFIMGDLFDDGLESEKPVHEVRLGGFYIGKYPVTQQQWQFLMPENISRFKGDRHPMEQVTWNEVQIFINSVSESVPAEYKADLPTEAQWEYAARSGGRSEKYAGSDTAESVAWYEKNSRGTTHPVGMKAPNGMGLHDMCGNVWEWCRDIYRADAYQYHNRENPVAAGPGRDRAIRGGGWNVDDWSVRCARRYNLPGDFHGPALGFRLVLNAR